MLNSKVKFKSADGFDSCSNLLKKIDQKDFEKLVSPSEPRKN